MNNPQSALDDNAKIYTHRLSGNENPLKALSKYCDNEPINKTHVSIAKSL
ncbi:hypothetical protein SA19142_03710 [Staphylococcus argenteus]|nr:hypothetical protein SARG0275_11570 [Staphylococcus argenteus]GBU02335.1 hypothetical protein SARG0275_14150 [Staphylococcus argenteus]GJF35747.1 hypothetical protein SA19023_05020 [Staphylococcus argenteus]GJF69171.1 hypothetical protein SA19142_03710 [Staphylococcus argenteus]GJF79226.1 hypothetical protein SA19252_01890 [Staphylococcus argenteus]